jgi:hypothetical protein
MLNSDPDVGPAGIPVDVEHAFKPHDYWHINRTKQKRAYNRALHEGTQHIYPAVSKVYRGLERGRRVVRRSKWLVEVALHPSSAGWRWGSALL